MRDREQASLSQPAAPFPLGRRFLVIPAGMAPPPDPARLPLYIEAGRVFGCRARPTTQLCLRARTPPAARNAARRHRHGHRHPRHRRGAAGRWPGILAVDADPRSGACGAGERSGQRCGGAGERAARLHCRSAARGAMGRTTPRLGGRQHPGACDRPALFAQGLAGAVGPGGCVILSGLMRPQTPAIRAHLQKAGLDFLAQEQQGEWVCLLASRQ